MSRGNGTGASDATQAARVLELCNQFQQMRRDFERDSDPLALAERFRQIDLQSLDAAHAWLTRMIVERYAAERITLDTGKFRIPKLDLARES